VSCNGEVVYIYLVFLYVRITILIIRGCQIGKIITILTGMLERNPHITLAHVNPDSFPPLNPESGKQCSMWFIGLAFAKCEKSEKSEKSENINVDLTYDIKSFVDTGIVLIINYTNSKYTII